MKLSPAPIRLIFIDNLALALVVKYTLYYPAIVHPIHFGNLLPKFAQNTISFTKC